MIVHRRWLMVKAAVTMKCFKDGLSVFQGTFIFSLVRYNPLKFNKTYVYPTWAYALGWCLGLFCVLVVPLWIIFKVTQMKGTVWQVSGLWTSTLNLNPPNQWTFVHEIIIIVSHVLWFWILVVMELVSANNGWTSGFNLVQSPAEGQTTNQYNSCCIILASGSAQSEGWNKQFKVPLHAIG